MLARIRLYLKNFDWLVFFPILFLVLFGLIEIYSISLGQGTLDTLNFKKQIVFAVIGFASLFIFSFLDSHFIKSLSRYWYIVAVLLLISVLIFGDTIRGTKGWFSLFGMGIQPVEIVRVILIMFLANYFSNLAIKVKTFKHFFFSGFFTFVLVALIMMQPDFGSAVMLIIVWLVLLFAAGFRKKYFIFIFLTGLILFSTAWFLLFKEYQKDRIMTFVNPGENSLDSGYNSSQAMIAIGSGGLTGKGVGFGSQSQLKFLPEAQNDFIFSVVAEELGFLGVFLILIFYGIFFFRCLSVLPKISNDFGVYFIIGACGLIFIQMFINIGMNLGVMPIVGLSLPFVSYGGSSLISLLIIVGIIENIIIRSKINY